VPDLEKFKNWEPPKAEIIKQVCACQARRRGGLPRPSNRES
jgi:hypothetical protein